MESPTRAFGKKHGFGGFGKRVLRFPKGEEQNEGPSIGKPSTASRFAQRAKHKVKFSAYFRRRLAALQTEHTKLGCFAPLGHRPGPP